MGSDYFSVPIFFIVFRETVEAGIIISVLLSFVEQLMTTGKAVGTDSTSSQLDSHHVLENDQSSGENSKVEQTRKLVRRMRWQIWAGTIAGFIIALAIGAAFIAVFYTKLTDLWAQTEQIWEGVFSLIASIIIYLMGIAFLKMDRARVKWRLKLTAAFDRSQRKALGQVESTEDKREGSGGKWALFLLPFITVLREGLEAVVFVGGVSLGEPAVAIPIPVIVGIIAGMIVGFIIYRTGSSTTLHWFLIGSTTLLFLIGAGLLSKAVGFFEYYRFASGVGGDVAETGDGPGSFDVRGNVWHLTYGNPEVGSPSTNGGWQIFNSILGYNNTASIGTILSYVFYWLLIVVTLIYLKWSEGRLTIFGKGSKAHQRMTERAAGKQPSSEPTSSEQGHSPVGSPSEEKKAELQP